MNLKKSLARQTIFDTLTVLRQIWLAGCDEYNLQQRDPFRDMKKFMPPGPPKRLPLGVKPNIPVWRFEDAMKIVENMHPGYVNVTRIMFLTGLSASEIAGIRKQDITEDSLQIVNFVSRNGKKSTLGKTPYRPREIPITKAIRTCLEEALQSAHDENLFRTAKGEHFSCSDFYRHWNSAEKKAGVDHMKPYSTRHSFAAWSLAIGVIPDLVVELMGHGSKEMVYEVYGKWKKDLNKDVESIRRFMGDDYGK